MNANIIEILKSMGYREMAKNVYGKPVGYSLYTFDKYQDDWQLTHWLRGVNDEPLRWKADNIDITMEKEDLLHEFLEVENGLTRHHWNYADNSFLSITDRLEL